MCQAVARGRKRIYRPFCFLPQVLCGGGNPPLPAHSVWDRPPWRAGQQPPDTHRWHLHPQFSHYTYKAARSIKGFPVAVPRMLPTERSTSAPRLAATKMWLPPQVTFQSTPLRNDFTHTTKKKAGINCLPPSFQRWKLWALFPIYRGKSNHMSKKVKQKSQQHFPWAQP